MQARQICVSAFFTFRQSWTHGEVQSPGHGQIRRHRAHCNGEGPEVQASTEIFWRAFGAARPPIVRYGTVLRAAPTSDTKPYRKKFLSSFFCYLFGTYLMQTPIIEEARNSCELRLPAGNRNDRAEPVTLHTDDMSYSAPSLRKRATGTNVFDRCLEQPPRIGPGAGRAQYGNSARYLCQLRDRARWANCAQ